jgi:hypothetical protein
MSIPIYSTLQHAQAVPCPMRQTVISTPSIPSSLTLNMTDAAVLPSHLTLINEPVTLPLTPQTSNLPVLVPRSYLLPALIEINGSNPPWKRV